MVELAHVREGRNWSRNVVTRYPQNKLTLVSWPWSVSDWLTQRDVIKFHEEVLHSENLFFITTAIVATVAAVENGSTCR